MPRYIYQLTDWPCFHWDQAVIVPLLLEVRNLQGRLLGKMEMLGFDLRGAAHLESLSRDVLKSAEIEGEHFAIDQVRSSVARKLGVEIAGLVWSDRHIDGMVEMLLDATEHYTRSMTMERLFDWHHALFPAGRSGMYKIQVGQWRDDIGGPMQVVSGALGKEKVHFQAPDASALTQEMQQFIDWLNAPSRYDLIIKAALAHLWFVTIHPFDDGNGRMARALTDMLLAQSDQSSQRFYSMSAQICLQRKQYYHILEKTQQGDMDVTAWLVWFLNCLSAALHASEYQLSRILNKATFWRNHQHDLLNARQIKIINKLLDGMEGKLSSSKWAKMNKCSKDTAVRDINDLLDKNILQKENAGGRSTHYQLKALV